MVRARHDTYAVGVLLYLGEGIGEGRGEEGEGGGDSHIWEEIFMSHFEYFELRMLKLIHSLNDEIESLTLSLATAPPSRSFNHTHTHTHARARACAYTSTNLHSSICCSPFLLIHFHL